MVGDEGREENADEPLVGEPGQAAPDETKGGVPEDRVAEETGREVIEEVIEGELRDCVVVDLAQNEALCWEGVAKEGVEREAVNGDWLVVERERKPEGAGDADPSDDFSLKNCARRRTGEAPEP